MSNYEKPPCFGKEYCDTDPECFERCPLRRECEHATGERFREINRSSGYGNYGGGYDKYSRYNRDRFTTTPRDTTRETGLIQREGIRFSDEEQKKVSLGQQIAHNSFIGCMRAVMDEGYDLVIKRISRIKRYG